MHQHHEHTHARRSGSHELKLVLVITAVFTIAEALGGYFTESLALFADAGHMLSDVGSLALALMAMKFATKPRSAHMTYGYYRAEILAALVNGVTLVVISIVIFYEAVGRFQDPPSVHSVPMLIVAAAGMLVNIFSAWLLSRSKGESLNVHGAFLHVLADLLGSVGAIVAAIVMLTTGWYLADPIISMVIGVLILASSWRLLKNSVTILMEGSPAHIDSQEIERAIRNIPNVVSIHDLHIWTVTSGFDAVSVHVVVEDCETMDQSQTILAEVRNRIRTQFGIDHTTIQIEHAGRSIRPDVILPSQDLHG